MSQTHEDRRWLSQQEAAEYLGVTDRTIRNYIARGVVPGHRIRGSRLVRVDRADLEAMLRTIPTTGVARMLPDNETGRPTANRAAQYVISDGDNIESTDPITVSLAPDEAVVHCRFCGVALTTETSVRVEAGPVCRTRSAVVA